MGRHGLQGTGCGATWPIRVRNGVGDEHYGALAQDTEAPVISDLYVQPGSGGLEGNTLSFRFVDSDTRSGRVRARATLDGSSDEVRIVRDELLVDTYEATPVTRDFDLSITGPWRVSVRVWDVGGGQYDSDEIQFDTATAPEVGIFVPEVTLSTGRPNPSSNWVAWELRRSVPGVVDMRIVNIGGRCVKEWSQKELPGGRTKVPWNGLNEAGARVAAGRYFLVVTDSSGSSSCGAVTIVPVRMRASRRSMTEATGKASRPRRGAILLVLVERCRNSGILEAMICMSLLVGGPAAGATFLVPESRRFRMRLMRAQGVTAY